MYLLHLKLTVLTVHRRKRNTEDKSKNEYQLFELITKIKVKKLYGYDIFLIYFLVSIILF